MWDILSTFTSEITNKNCHVTFLLTPLLPPKVSHIIWMAPKDNGAQLSLEYLVTKFWAWVI
jgi:hypothetical protein